MKKLETEIRKCSKCVLMRDRKNAVPGTGNYKSEIMFIGEAPGKNEDNLGEPFVGTAGKSLEKLLEYAGLSRKDIYITNIVKCRPPQNRKPKRKEINICIEYLKKQIQLIHPKLICLLGAVALNTFVKEKRISILHGRIIQKNGIRYYILYHPAAVLYNRKLNNDMINDMKKLKFHLTK